MNQRLFCFVGGEVGAWRVTKASTITGEPLAIVKKLNIVAGPCAVPPEASWLFRGVTSNERYVMRTEKAELSARQPSLGRPEAVCAALIPIRKNGAWWALPQDARRTILEDQSRHIKIGLNYLPAIARRLHHCRDVGSEEPFDFLTWFEFAPPDIGAFDQLVADLRATQEWSYVDREVEIRLVRDAA